ncbi:MAG: 2-dehydropantoate 2-reductase [Desulfatiglans sp.]|jgi:2-dehydropantoate 2-reductase|nr:2-dehydropantoate 2-reductase [Desulfatiglans sp.]
MEILIVGPGAMGNLFAARLSNAGYHVTLLDHNPERADRINRQGIFIEGVSGEYSVNVPVISDPAGIRPDIIIIFVKSGKTKEAALSVRDITGKNTMITTLQNGLGNREMIEAITGNRVIGGITSEGATSLGAGRVRHAGAGMTVLGPGRATDERLENLVSALNMAGFRADSANNIDDLIWGKLIINAGINALTAITGLKNGQLPMYEGTLNIMKDAVEEAVRVSEALNITLPYSDPMEKVLEVCRNTSGNIASMLQDVLNKRATEIDFINGAIHREGIKAGIPAPVNLFLTRLVKTIEASYSNRTF